MQRGDIVMVAFKDARKLRPALILQADELFQDLSTVLLLPLTRATADLPLTRVTLQPSDTNGLHAVSQIMVSRPQSVMRDKIGQAIGRVDDTTMLDVSRKLALLLGLAT